MRIHSYQQLESSDCGITCIRIIARFYGKKISQGYLRSLCEGTRQGISVQEVQAVLSKLHFETACVRLKIDDLKSRDMPFPAILYWNHSHFVVVYGIRNDRIYFIDPAVGKTSLPREEFENSWYRGLDYGVAILAEPTNKFRESDFEYENSISRLARQIGVTAKDNLKTFILSFVCTSLILLFDIISPFLFQYGIDTGIGEARIGVVWIVLLSQFAIFIGNFTSNAINEMVMSRLGISVGLDLAMRYLNRLVLMPMSFFNSKIPSDLIQKVDDQMQIRDVLISLPNQLILSFLTILVFMGIMFYYSPVILVVFLILSIFGLGWNLLFLRHNREIDYSRFATISEQRNQIYELVNGIAEIKINNADKIRVNKWHKLQENLNALSYRMLKISILNSGGRGMFMRLKEIAVTAVCSAYVIEGDMTMGVMMSIGYVAGRLAQPISTLEGLIPKVQSASMSMDRVSEILEPADADNAENAGLLNLDCVRFNDVTFKYGGKNSPVVLKNINVSFDRGSVTAVVGATGGGKSTLIKLLLGLFTPMDGVVSVSGVDLKSIDQDKWLSSIGVVMQDGKIFSDTILSNVAMCDEAGDERRVWEALKIACIDHFVHSLPMGLMTRLGNSGIELSGGQRQRILIARAVYKNPELFILDEATSSLDANTERSVMKNLSEFFKGRTVVIVAHRLSTVMNADNIIYLENGRISESGSHDELSRKRGSYYELIKNQLELAEN